MKVEKSKQLSKKQQICLTAMGLLGEHFSQEEKNKPTYELAMNHYTSVKQCVMRLEEWTCAKSRIVLNEPKQIALGWRWSYSLPANSARLLGVLNKDMMYELEGNEILTDYEGSVYISFINMEVPDEEMDPLLEYTIALYLSKRISYQVTGSLSLLTTLTGMCQEALQEASRINRQEIQHLYTKRNFPMDKRAFCF